MTVTREDVRARILDAASQLLHEGGTAALTTRGVAEAAGVQAPTIYRLFGDKDGLLDAVAEHVMALHAHAKAAHVASQGPVDPLQDLRDGWRSQIEFALANPSVFRLLSAPERVRDSPAAQVGRAVLLTRVHRLAEVGLLRIAEELAVDLVHSAGTGVIQTLLATPVDRRDPAVAETMFDAVLAAITTGETVRPHDGPVPAAISLRAAAPGLPGLSEPERVLLAEWLDRVVQHSQGVGFRAS